MTIGSTRVKHAFKTLIIFTLLFFSLSAWSASTKQEVLKLQEQVKAMQSDLEEIKKLLKAGAKPAPQAPKFEQQDVVIGQSPFKGEENATVTLIEYSDYQCPFCARHYRQVMPALVSEYVDSGKLKYVMRENPIPGLHPNAFNASMAALCAGDQDKYWDMHNLLFDNQRALGVGNLKKFAETLGMDTTAFNECLDKGKYKKQIDDDIASGMKLGVNGTPGFFLGITDTDDPNKADMRVFIRGAQTLANFKRAINQLIAVANRSN